MKTYCISRIRGESLSLHSAAHPSRIRAAQSLSYTSGQNVVAGLRRLGRRAPTARSYFVFGYMNRNWEEEIDVPVGPDNGFNVGGADQGQPTHFLPRRNRFIFSVPVPAGLHRERRADLDADDAGQDRKGVCDAASRLQDRRRGARRRRPARSAPAPAVPRSRRTSRRCVEVEGRRRAPRRSGSQSRCRRR